VTAQVLLDASFWIALRDAREPWHSQARRAAEDLLRDHTRLVFTSFILAETHAYFSRSAAMRNQILDDAEKNPALRWEPVLRSDEVSALALLRQHRDKEYSLCDAISFVVMQRLGIRHAAAFDNHFRQFGGFQIIP
jgi:predicted nucleic acid-binding protein